MMDKEGTVRLGKDFQTYKKVKSGWKKCKANTNNAIYVAKLFRHANNSKLVLDREFFKGGILDGKCVGARVKFLPCGTQLEKAYSLFAPELTLNDEKADHHWDVMHLNPNGSHAYLYSIRKRQDSIKKKYKLVKEFDKRYSTLVKKVRQNLADSEDFMALPMLTLLKTYMRIGSEIYYKAHGHKGLTTLTKDNIKVNRDSVTFKFVAKDGVPQEIAEKFDKAYIERLKKALRACRNSFVFGLNGKVLTDTHFKSAFKKYCGKEFYPHIVRSHFATVEAQRFAKLHRKLTKSQVNGFFTKIAGKLGHRKFCKKDNAWKECFTVTVNHYIDPKVVEKIKSKVV